MLVLRRSHVYIVTNFRCTVLYVGVTSDLSLRIAQHRNEKYDGFTKRYGLKRLVWFEAFDSIVNAIAGEKQIKGWKRNRKLALINAMNPNWDDLAADW
jgi:putative endonuclease